MMKCVYRFLLNKVNAVLECPWLGGGNHQAESGKRKVERLIKIKKWLLRKLGIKERVKDEVVSKKRVWVVTGYEDGQEPIVSVFDNQDAASGYLSYACGVHENVCIDEAPVYSSFFVFKEEA